MIYQALLNQDNYTGSNQTQTEYENRLLLLHSQIFRTICWFITHDFTILDSIPFFFHYFLSNSIKLDNQIDKFVHDIFSLDPEKEDIQIDAIK